MPHGSELVNEEPKAREAGEGDSGKSPAQKRPQPSLRKTDREMHPKLSSESKGSAKSKNATWEDLKPQRGGWEEGSHCS